MILRDTVRKVGMYVWILDMKGIHKAVDDDLFGVDGIFWSWQFYELIL
jgi:hypothetical protein